MSEHDVSARAGAKAQLAPVVDALASLESNQALSQRKTRNDLSYLI